MLIRMGIEDPENVPLENIKPDLGKNRKVKKSRRKLLVKPPKFYIPEAVQSELDAEELMGKGKLPSYEPDIKDQKD